MQNAHSIRVETGYAADERGSGVAYARVVDGARERTLRATFRAERRGALDQRSLSFAAIAALTPLLRKHAADITIVLDDAEAVADLSERRELPVALMLPYVRARCALNTFKSARLLASKAPNHLAARARAEVSILIAA